MVVGDFVSKKYFSHRLTIFYYSKCITILIEIEFSEWVLQIIEYGTNISYMYIITG